MKLLEYEAKALLKMHGIAVPQPFIATNEPPVFLPAVLKSQVPTGGRGKAGGVVIVQTQGDYDAAVEKLRKRKIKGFLPQTILGERLLDIQRELYLSLIIDKTKAIVTLMAHTKGGVEIEDNAAEEFLRLPLDGKNAESVGQQLADYYDLPDKAFVLQDMIEQLFRLFNDQDATLLEINPLVLTTDGKLIAGDCKLELDDAAAFRHPEWGFEQKKVEANFVTLDPHGNVATIANGAGLAMATVDAVADAGMIPANFLDIGGGASEASVLAAFKRIMDYPDIKVIIINIFAGITRCDEVARAIIAAKAQLADLPPLAIRLAGTNYEQAATLLSKQNIEIQPSLERAITNAQRHVK